MPKTHKEPSILKMTKAKIMGILALAAFITGAITQLDQSVTKVTDIVKKYLPTKVLVQVGTKHFAKLPFSLKNSISEENKLLYWYYLRVDNKSPDALQVNIAYKIHSGPVARSTDNFLETVGPMGFLARYENPSLEILNYDDRGTLEITWSITDDVTNKQLNNETTTIELLPRNVVAWDLKDPDDKPVDRDFLLASLAAWTLNPVAVKKRADELLRGVSWSLDRDEDAHARDWFRECYNKVFKGSQGLKITHGLDSFPSRSEQRIQLPSELLRKTDADPIEGALLLGALSNIVSSDVRVHVGIFVVPDAHDAPTSQMVLFSWTRTRGNDWHALDVSHSSTLNFEENEKGATAQLAALLQREPDILQGLNKTGTFLKEGRNTVALDLEKAQENFRIGGLP